MNEADDRITLEADGSWSDVDLHRLDPGLDWVVALIEAGEWDQVYLRTGMQRAAGTVQHMQLLVKMARANVSVSDEREMLERLHLKVPSAYDSPDRPAHVTARIDVDTRERALSGDRNPTLRQQIVDILKEQRIVRLELSRAIHAFNADALADIGLGPGSRRPRGPGRVLGGSGVVVGIIDDGCALAHRNFMKPHVAGAPLESRIIALWDQARTDVAGGWQPPPGNFEGLELTKATINAAIQAAQIGHSGAIDEDAVYRQLKCPIADLAAHGTHVMDIAAGNGCAPMGSEGVASGADIVFVQLPAAAIASGGVALAGCVIEGLRYIFGMAGEKPVVINVSYGGYAGPHDGTSFVEAAIDEALELPNRAVVVAAGNGYEANCHAHGFLPTPADTLTWRWVVKPQDPTPNDLEIWYDHGAKLEIRLTAPDGTQLGPVPLGAQPQSIKIGSRTVGRIFHKSTSVGYRPNLITIKLNQTASAGTGMGSPPAPPGTWAIRLTNAGTVAATVDAWIERDTSGRPGGAVRQQSQFHPEDADACGTLASYATGRLAIAVGAYNSATQEVCRYSACGPTRDRRPKPDVLAPAEEDAAGRGVLCASSRSAMPTRMNGTSASAPQVTGFIALLFQRAAEIGETLTAAKVLELVQNGAQVAASAAPAASALRPNRQVDADARRKDKQGDARIWPHLIGAGKISWPETIAQM